MAAVCSARYQLECILGKGSSASVWKGKLNGVVGSVALKVFNADRSRDGFREKSIVEGLHAHDSIIKFFGDVGTFAYPVLAFEYFPSENLYEHTMKLTEKMQLDIAFCVFDQLGEGYKYLHSKGIIHCDGRPENYLMGRVDGRWVAKIIDFNVSCKANVVKKQSVVQTVYYRSPEAIHCPGFYSERIDLWALACVIDEVLTCRIRFYIGTKNPFLTLAQERKLSQLHMHAIGCLPPPHFQASKVYPYSDEMEVLESDLADLEDQYKQGEKRVDLAKRFATVVRACLTWESITAERFLEIMQEK